MPQIINKDILTITEGLIAHQCNCKGVMGAGLAKGIKNKYPYVYKHYREAHLANNLYLGQTQILKVNDNLYVANLMAQDGYGTDKQYTDYSALSQCLTYVHQFAEENKGINIYLPYGIGCGLAGGNWSLVNKLIEKHCPSAILYKLT
jgi:O-acetyl-ADP-ribose deacetylase (regulator of RNase III)